MKIFFFSKNRLTSTLNDACSEKERKHIICLQKNKRKMSKEWPSMPGLAAVTSALGKFVNADPADPLDDLLKDAVEVPDETKAPVAVPAPRRRHRASSLRRALRCLLPPARPSGAARRRSLRASASAASRRTPSRASPTRPSAASPARPASRASAGAVTGPPTSLCAGGCASS